MNYVLVLQIIVAIILFIIIIFGIRGSIASSKARRIGYYSLEPIKDNSLSISDKLVNRYISFVHGKRNLIKKSSYFKSKSKKYEKYIKYKNKDKIIAIDFITNKIIIAFIFIILTIFSQVFATRNLSLIDYIINFLIGYYLLDIYLFFYYKKQTKLIENELLRAVIIMNNAFKSGRSTLQALKIAADELPEPISDEFRKMYLDMKYGLSVDAVFDRFSKRVGLEEANYLSSSLTILNKTGGNIVEVFSSIERTLFDKKKLNEELKNISSGPNMIVKILSIVPIVFVFLIYILDPSYFAPLFNSVLGYIIIGIIVIMFSIYLLLLRRILKIEV
ncbi:MAG: type II secretion system F family protein [Bacilli bacterium]|nr:type II secretion system F family protein [Bacilli bacterium]